MIDTMNDRPYCIGLTGGIGSGKSTVAALFAKLGAEVIDTDALSHALTRAQGAAMPAIVASFGNAVVAQDGALDRTLMRQRVFADPHARQRLEQILHPLIRAEAQQRVQASHAPYVILMVPLLVENLPAYRPLLDRILVVDCTEMEQIRRTALRPGLDRIQAEAIVTAQASREARRAIADDLIDNALPDGNLEPAVHALHRQYLAAAEK